MQDSCGLQIVNVIASPRTLPRRHTYCLSDNWVVRQERAHACRSAAALEPYSWTLVHVRQAETRCTASFCPSIKLALQASGVQPCARRHAAPPARAAPNQHSQSMLYSTSEVAQLYALCARNVGSNDGLSSRQCMRKLCAVAAREPGCGMTCSASNRAFSAVEELLGLAKMLLMLMARRSRSTPRSDSLWHLTWCLAACLQQHSKASWVQNADTRRDSSAICAQRVLQACRH